MRQEKIHAVRNLDSVTNGREEASAALEQGVWQITAPQNSVRNGREEKTSAALRHGRRQHSTLLNMLPSTLPSSYLSLLAGFKASAYYVTGQNALKPSVINQDTCIRHLYTDSGLSHNDFNQQNTTVSADLCVIVLRNGVVAFLWRRVQENAVVDKGSNSSSNQGPDPVDPVIRKVQVRNGRAE